MRCGRSQRPREAVTTTITNTLLYVLIDSLDATCMSMNNYIYSISNYGDQGVVEKISEFAFVNMEE